MNIITFGGYALKKYKEVRGKYVEVKDQFENVKAECDNIRSLVDELKKKSPDKIFTKVQIFDPLDADYINFISTIAKSKEFEYFLTEIEEALWKSLVTDATDLKMIQGMALGVKMVRSELFKSVFISNNIKEGEDAV
jgi:hypothetical protein